MTRFLLQNARTLTCVLVPFAKYHGLGNDFVIVDLRDADQTVVQAVNDPAFARAICDRQFGVGADGLLPILPSAVADAKMRVLNADGSEAEMCGNGLRCVARHLAGKTAGQSATLAIETGAGVLRCAISELAGDIAVTVDMGKPRLLRAEIPLAPAAGVGEGTAVGQVFAETSDLFTAVSMGNPHAIFFVESRAAAWAHAQTEGPVRETHAWFPRRTNVEFAAMRPDGAIDLVVWERGCGITLACGTGACATVVAACLTGRATVGRETLVHLPGGALAITVTDDYQTVMMRGPATHVFDGRFDPHLRMQHQRPA